MKSLRKRLRALTQKQRTGFDPKALADSLSAESDRAFIILCGSLVEDRLRDKIIEKIEEIDGNASVLNEGNAEAMSFAQILNLALMVGVLDERLKERLEIIKLIRNVAAHSLSEITFEQPDIREAVGIVIQPLNPIHRHDTRYVFGARCQLIGYNLIEQALWETFATEVSSDPETK